MDARTIDLFYERECKFKVHTRGESYKIALELSDVQMGMVPQASSVKAEENKKEIQNTKKSQIFARVISEADYELQLFRRKFL